MLNLIDVTVDEALGTLEWLPRVEPFIARALEARGIRGWELSVFLCADACIHELNRDYRGIDAPTDVLSFEIGDSYIDEEGAKWLAAGDIIISLDTLAANCTQFSVSADEELKRLLIHGILHLSGHDHKTNEPDEEMLVLQEELLADLQGATIID
jgi:probable rRNA maturation factor